MTHPVVGVWEVTAEGAPFGSHVMTFHADGTLLQSNPDLGNRTASDSNGMGVWEADGTAVTGAFLEFTVDRLDTGIVRKGVIAFEIDVSADEFRGMATANWYALDGSPCTPPKVAILTGHRFTLDRRHAQAEPVPWVIP